MKPPPTAPTLTPTQEQGQATEGDTQGQHAAILTHVGMRKQMITIQIGKYSILLGSASSGGVTVNRATGEKLLMAPFELMAATSTSYSVLGARSRRVTLVVPKVFTVVWSPVLLLNRYLIL